MIPVDLITGFLGSGKTTFMIAYANYLVNTGLKVGIIENDLGAINVDMLLLSTKLGDRCALEMITGGGDQVTYQRRLKTKLIALGMQGYDRILIEPSGIFDVETFFDVLYEAPLDQWYALGNVIALVDTTLPVDLSKASRYVLASEVACAGQVVWSHLDKCDASGLMTVQQYLEQCLKEVSCQRQRPLTMTAKAWQNWSSEEWDQLMNCGYEMASWIHRTILPEQVYRSLFFFEFKLDPDMLKARLPALFTEEKYGRIYRVKGFGQDEKGQWYQINATAREFEMIAAKHGQEVLIVIGENLNEASIRFHLIGGK